MPDLNFEKLAMQREKPGTIPADGARVMNEIDEKAWKLLAELQRDARQPLKNLAQSVGLSLAATSERIKRLEEQGVISAYQAQLNPSSLGKQILAMVGITVLQPHKAALISYLQGLPEIIECLHVTGQDSFLLRIACRDIQHLEQLVGQINHYGETRTSIIMSAPIPWRGYRA